MKERVPYILQFDTISALKQEIETLRNTVKTQQEAINAVTTIIDELRKENQLLKDGLYLREINNEIGRLKQEVTRTSEAYIQLSERHEKLLAEYIKQ